MFCLLSACPYGYTSGDCSPLCAALHSEYNVSIYPPVLAFPIVRVYYSLACFLCFVSALLCLFPLDWVFLTSLSGGIVFSHSFLQFLQFVPRGGSFLFPFFPPVRQTTDRIGNRIFLFSRWIIDHKVEARSVNVMNTHTDAAISQFRLGRV